MHNSISQMKHQLDATLCRFYSAESLYMFRAQAPISHHISLLEPSALIRRCDDLPATITHVPVAAVLVLNTPDDGRLRPKHVEWLCRNKTCTVSHQVGVSFDLCYDARKHKIKIKVSVWCVRVCVQVQLPLEFVCAYKNKIILSLKYIHNSVFLL